MSALEEGAQLLPTLLNNRVSLYDLIRGDCAGGAVALPDLRVVGKVGEVGKELSTARRVEKDAAVIRLEGAGARKDSDEGSEQ